MGLFESVVTLSGLAGTGIGVASGLKDLKDVLNSRLKLEDVLTNSVQSEFADQLPKFKHYCKHGEPEFLRDEFRKAIESTDIPVLSADELRALLQEQPSLPPRGDEM